MTKIGEDTKVTLDLKTIGMIVGFAISLSSMYFVLTSRHCQSYDTSRARGNYQQSFRI